MKLLSPAAARLLLLLTTFPFLPTAFAGYCNWGPDGTAASSICDGDVQGGEWCNLSQDNCEKLVAPTNGGCAGNWCTNDGSGPTPPAPTPTPPSPTQPTNPSAGTATTTRYWDCSGGACACSFIPDHLFGDNEPTHCHSNAMFAAPANNPHGASYYGAAAISQALGGGDWMAEGCGKCWKVTGTSNIPGYEDVSTTLVLKGTNYCPPANAPCSNNKPHFDIAAPGFDVGEFSLSNDCSGLEPDEIEGFESCGRWRIDNQDPDVLCDCSKFTSPTLRAGCENFYGLKWDNPTVEYEVVDCPTELSDLHCGHPYVDEGELSPDTCGKSVLLITLTYSTEFLFCLRESMDAYTSLLRSFPQQTMSFQLLQQQPQPQLRHLPQQPLALVSIMTNISSFCKLSI